ncbi:hypothetical protein NEOLEDRAFT_770410 [Neolentinus lepideus HHB14362 ss-1]|uniref:Uncharacterized protein n=1 Tax=Neolentinus lepideus HHB14362 ss-1 TaxID=1314782 RepID=A0A165UU07_9AGAM|nr:hypothetical protein NEOLEDRAFT_770410 [Neolentinus lepideus HHB14362 ss-1]
MFHQMHCLQMIRRTLTSGNIGTHDTLFELLAINDVDWIREQECKDWEQLYEWTLHSSAHYARSCSVTCGRTLILWVLVLST